MAATTGNRASSWLSTRPVTGTTSRFAVILDFLLSSENRFFKAEIYTILKIIPLARSIRITRSATTKEAGEDIFKATKAGAIKATEAACTTAKATISSRCTVLIIGCPLLLVAQRFISLLDFFIFVLRPSLLINIGVVIFR